LVQDNEDFFEIAEVCRWPKFCVLRDAGSGPVNFDDETDLQSFGEHFVETTRNNEISDTNIGGSIEIFQPTRQ
jgi:hypothetical protein